MLRGRLIIVTFTGTALLLLAGGLQAESVVAEPDQWRTSVAFRAPSGRMAEPTVAVDPSNKDHIAVAADPYLGPTRIQVAVTKDGGRTWTPPVTIRPPGFTKSFDPDLAFTRSGDLLVSGGASRTGRRYCQPGSVIFLARVAGGRTSYELITRPKDGVYVDRPALAYDPATETTTVSWTRSAGRNAECLAVARRSTTWLAWRRGPAGKFDELRIPLKQQAAYGSQIVPDGEGRVQMVVAGWTGTRQRVSVIGVDLGRRATYETVTFGAGRRPPLSLGNDLPLNLSAASISGGGGRLLIAWTEQRGAEVRSRMALREGGSDWRTLPGPEAQGTPMLPTVAFAPGGSPLVVQADVTRRGLSFGLWEYTAAGWKMAKGLGRTSARGYPELGELLGLDATGEIIAAAVPAGSRPSALAVSVRTFPPKATRQSAAPSPEGGPYGQQRQRSQGPMAAIVGGSLLLAAAAGVVLAFRMRKARRRPR